MNKKEVSIDTLPPVDVRWVAARKAAVIRAVHNGEVTRGAVLEKYNMTEYELQLWEKGLDRFGIKGVMVTRIQTRNLR